MTQRPQMLLTFNCNWTLPEENHTRQRGQQEHDLTGMSAVIGTQWKPICPANENLPRWLQVYG